MVMALVVTRTRDRPLLLERAIQSVLAQTFREWNHVIVNDGGAMGCVDDLAMKYASDYKDRLLIVHNEFSAGMEAASNLGISTSDAKYILIHDDDDSLFPSFLERTVAYLENPPYLTLQGVCTWTNRIEERIEAERVVTLGTSVFRELRGGLTLSDACGTNPAPPISFLFRRSAYDEVGQFDESLPVLGDWEFLLRFLTKFDVGIIPESLANYHIRSSAAGAMSNSISDRSERFATLAKIIRNRFIRDHTNSSLGLLLQQNEQTQLLQRLYAHPVLGRTIRLWSRFVNGSIPRTPF